MPEAQEHAMSEEKEREVERETSEHHALLTLREREGVEETEAVPSLHLCC